MLSIESPRWGALSHAYRDATNVPAMLRDLQRGASSAWREAWDGVWSSLCHQGTVYSATYAAIPHIVALAADTSVSNPRHADYLIFVGAVATSSDAAAMPDDLRTDYSAALMRAEPLVVAALESKPTSVAIVVYLLQAMAALHGCTRTAEIIDGFVDGEFIPRCPAEQCGVEMYVSIDGARMFATLEDPATEEVGERVEIVPPSRPSDAEAGAWNDDAVLPLLVELAGRAGHRELAAKLALWDGTIRCPKCRQPFALRTALLNPTDL